MEEQDYIDTSIIVHNNAVYEKFYRTIDVDDERLADCAHTMQTNLTEPLLDRILSQVPIEWNVSRSNLNALKTYLLYRSSHLEEICKVIIASIKS